MTDWKTRHPFKVGQQVRPRAMQLHAAPLTVTMRGEDSIGFWIVINDGWRRLDAGLYEAVEAPENVTP